MKSKLGIIGIVREEMAADLGGTLRKLKAAGYSGVEFGFGSFKGMGGAAAVGRAMAEAGMEVVTCHAGREDLKERFGALVEACREAGSRHVTISWAEMDSPESIKADAALYNEVGPRLGKEGITLCYHNHEHEFMTRLGSRMPMDMLLQQTAPEALQVNLDIAWAAYGGIQPVAFMERYAGRIPILHMKDLRDLTVRGCFTALGTGLIDVAGCVRAARDAGVSWLVVEQDQPWRLKGMDLAVASALNLRELGFEG